MKFTWARQLLTEDDDKTPDIAMIGWALGLLSFIGFAGYDLIWLKHAFSPTAYGIGLTGVLGGGAASLWGKNKADRVSNGSATAPRHEGQQ